MEQTRIESPVSLDTYEAPSSLESTNYTKRPKTTPRKDSQHKKTKLNIKAETATTSIPQYSAVLVPLRPTTTTTTMVAAATASMAQRRPRLLLPRWPSSPGCLGHHRLLQRQQQQRPGVYAHGIRFNARERKGRPDNGQVYGQRFGKFWETSGGGGLHVCSTLFFELFSR